MSRSNPSRSRARSLALAALTLAALGGCAQAPKPLYAWGDFPRLQYDRLARANVNPDEQVRKMEEHVEKTKAAGLALPPGFRAHLALMQMELGRPELARSLLAAERYAFPESGHYIDSVARRLEAGQKGAAR